ncbi:MAG: hypothetical protein D6719_05050 [Candidatus Dadabacteria bacterium]|nr:MAG: hypothetical protein D6719_05050 [Candidatus Dadabacteria bacterium]
MICYLKKARSAPTNSDVKQETNAEVNSSQLAFDFKGLKYPKSLKNSRERFEFGHEHSERKNDQNSAIKSRQNFLAQLKQVAFSPVTYFGLGSTAALFAQNKYLAPLAIIPLAAALRNEIKVAALNGNREYKNISQDATVSTLRWLIKSPGLNETIFTSVELTTALAALANNDYLATAGFTFAVLGRIGSANIINKAYAKISPLQSKTSVITSKLLSKIPTRIKTFLGNPGAIFASGGILIALSSVLKYGLSGNITSTAMLTAGIASCAAAISVAMHEAAKKSPATSRALYFLTAGNGSFAASSLAAGNMVMAPAFALWSAGNYFLARRMQKKHS